MESAESLSCLICIFSYLVNYGETLNYNIPEGQPKFTFVGNIAANSSIRDLISEDKFENLEFRFMNVDTNKYLKHFNIDSKTSDLTINEPLDRETICEFSSAFSCKFEIEVAAQESIGAFFQKIPVNITVLDINDHSPYFRISQVFFNISEDEVVGKSISLDTAIDRDSSNFTVQGYELVDKDVPFTTEFQQSSDGDKLLLVIAGELDREKEDSYSLSVVARDGGNPPLNGSLKIDVIILDANDNKPEFERTLYNVTVQENMPINATILTVTATDKDIDENAIVMYSLDSQQPQNIKDAFFINASTGEVKLSQQLAYTPDNLRTVKILAVDKGIRPQTSSAVIEVRVEDSENNPPVITIDLLSDTGYARASEYAFGTVVSYVFVTDSDEARNGRVFCSIQSDHFALQTTEPKEYKVIVNNSLDREVQDKHDVVVSCHDDGVPNLTTQKNFTVRVLDENDNEPIFSEVTYHAKIQENNIINYTIKQVLATDIDIGENARVSYYLNTKDREYFYINPVSGLITSRISFDRENTSSYEFEVFATDGGNPQMSSSATVSIDVEDVNDNAPLFLESPWKIYTPESDLKDTNLGPVVANDPDEGRNGYISYSLIGKPTNLPFEVLPDGTIKSTDILDRENVAVYNFTVMAIDNGTDKRMSSIVTVSVYVVDINDNYPVIEYPRDPDHVKYITYMMPEKAQILKLEVTDADEGKNGELLYRITHRNDTDMFDLGRNGEIYISRRMYESDIDHYVLGIEVSDKGDVPKSVELNVTIMVLPRNETALAETKTSVASQNVVIAVVVVLVTVVMAAVILIIIWIVKRIDRQKKKYAESMYINQNGDNDSGFSSNGGRGSPDAMKLFGSRLLPSGPTLISSSNEKVEPKSKDVKFQNEVHVREKSVDSNNDPALHNTVQLHRLTSLRLHQALIQNQNKTWSSQTELNDAKEIKKQEDLHSDMSVDTLTYDSGIGGSVSDTGDLRLVQLQKVVRQSGRRGQPPHKKPHSPSKPPRIIARGRQELSSDSPPERPPPLKSSLYKTASPVQTHNHISHPVSPSRFSTSSPTPVKRDQNGYDLTISGNRSQSRPTQPTISPRMSPSKNVVQDLLMYKQFQYGLKPATRGHLPVDESADTTNMDDDDDSTMSGSYYINSPTEEICMPKVGTDIYMSKVGEDIIMPKIKDVYV